MFLETFVKKSSSSGTYVAVPSGHRVDFEAGSTLNLATGVTVAKAVVGATGRIAKFTGSSANANFGDGYGAIENELTLTGTVAGPTAAQSTWVNVPASTVVGSNIVYAHSDGIWVSATGTPMSSATAVIGGRLQYVAEGGGDPGALFLWDTNISSNALTAMFRINAKVDVGWVTAALSGGPGHIPFFKEASTGTVHYINVYTS